LARNDDGEFELILGNKQLVSVFLIVVILLGVFFSMGYIVGRNSSPATVAGSSGKPIIVDSAPRTAAPLPEEPATAPVSAPPATEPLSEPQAKVTPAPVIPAPVVEKPSPTHSNPPPEKKAEQPKKVEPKVEPKPAPAEIGKRAQVGEPPPGIYLQVSATTRPDAEIVSESLMKKGFHSMVAPVPDSPTHLHRVIVGPLKDAAEMSDVRLRLEVIGFKPYVRKY
jgi:cell division septation protein DedD